jgi:dihydropteroate synthase
VKIFPINHSEEAVEIFRRIGVDAHGIRAMLLKTIHLNVLLENQPCKIANIIKQEMLAVGGDAAIARGSVSCSVKVSDILIMGTVKQILHLAEKLRDQPFGLQRIAEDLSETVKNFNKQKYILKTSLREIRLGDKTRIMGILNVTPDSFSDGGLFNDKNRAIEQALKMEEDGADLIDIGGESTRPGSRSVPASVELKRVLPIIDALRNKLKIPISIDTRKAEVARAAMAAGAEVINDISALNADQKMVSVVKDTDAAVILMHMRGTPRHMQEGDLTYVDLMGEIVGYLKKSIGKALQVGVREDQIVIDPGIGFGKTYADNYRIIRHLHQLRILGMPVLVGASRKAFIGKITGDEPRQRVEGTAAAVTAAMMNGCHIVRVHDVAPMKKVVAVTDAIVRS